MPRRMLILIATCVSALASLHAKPAAAPLKDNRRAFSLPSGVTIRRDVAYGGDPAQRMDVYLPEAGKDAPLIVLVHGGSWAYGDKAAPLLVRAKIARWVSRGFALVSVDYRMLPAADPLVQAQDVARALAAAQQQAPAWHADPHRVILMGHSAGAHLVALIAARPDLVRAAGAKPWLGTIALDSAALDVPAIMQAPHAVLHDKAFGKDPTFWQTVSPQQQLHAAPMPILAVCSSLRRNSCPAAQRFVARIKALDGRGEVLPEDLNHRQINIELGQPSAYTAAVERFMATLDPTVAARLAGGATSH